MRTFSGIVAIALLAGCGSASTPDAGLAGDVAPPAAAVQAQPETAHPFPIPAAGSHTLLVGQHGDQIDPADLEPLALKAMACGEAVVPREYINETRAMGLGRVQRDGEQLHVGGILLDDYGPVMVDGEALDHDVAFYYFGVLKRLDLDIVYVDMPEDHEFMLVDAGTGTAYSTKGLPVASPSGRFLGATGRDEMNYVGIQIVEHGAAGLRGAKIIETRTYPCGLTWASETRAMFQELKPAVVERSLGDRWWEDMGLFGAASIELVDGEWIYTPAKD